MRRARYTVPGREFIDTLDAVRRHDFSARDLPGHGLKAVARHLGLAGPERELIPGARVYAVFGKDPEDQADVKWLLDHLGGVDRQVMHDTVRLLTGSASDWLDESELVGHAEH